jgi:aspartyl/asparaginyl-tRNA synthetase
VRDGSGYLEVVVDASQMSADEFEACKNAGIESAVTITGTLQEHFKKP